MSCHPWKHNKPVVNNSLLNSNLKDEKQNVFWSNLLYWGTKTNRLAERRYRVCSERINIPSSRISTGAAWYTPILLFTMHLWQIWLFWRAFCRHRGFRLQERQMTRQRRLEELCVVTSSPATDLEFQVNYQQLWDHVLARFDGDGCRCKARKVSSLIPIKLCDCKTTIQCVTRSTLTNTSAAQTKVRRRLSKYIYENKLLSYNDFSERIV